VWRGGLRRGGGPRGGVLLGSVGREERGPLRKGKGRGRERCGRTTGGGFAIIEDMEDGRYTLGKHNNMRHDTMSTFHDTKYERRREARRL